MQTPWQLTKFSAWKLPDLIFYVTVLWLPSCCGVPVLSVTQLTYLKLNQSSKVPLASCILNTFAFSFSPKPEGKWKLIGSHNHQISPCAILPFPHSDHDWGLLSIKDIQNNFIDTSSSTFTMKLTEEVNAITYSCTQQDFIVGRTYKKEASLCLSEF